MISIMFKDCCMKCGDVDVDYDYVESILGDKVVCVYCSHMKVCKTFGAESTEDLTDEKEEEIE